MQDSIEDYLNLTKKCKPDEAIKISKGTQITTQIKKDCDTRAMKIVEFSIDGMLRPEVFLRCLPFINQSHYQDIVEERAITKLCGYSLCGETIPDMPKKQFYISTKSNKIYDITDRKNYCSNFCYKASLHIKKQIDNSPLWLRKYEDYPRYQLLSLSEGGLPGLYIDQGMAKPVVEPSFTSVSTFTEHSLSDMVDREIYPDKAKNKQTCYKKSSRILKTTMQTISENVEQAEEEINELEIKVTKTKEDEHKKPDSKIRSNKSMESKQLRSIKMLPVIDENEEKLEMKPDAEGTGEKLKVSTKTKSKKSTTQPKINIEALIRKSLNEWLTLDTYIFIYGEDKIKKTLDEKKLSNYFESLHVTKLQRNQQVKYMDICKRLHLQEMADEKFDKALVSNTKLMPLPDYKKLKDKTKDLNIKVKSFYDGVLYEKEDTNFSSKTKSESQDAEGDSPTFMPLVDVNSQNAMRRKIFLNSVNKTMQQHLRAMRIQAVASVLSDLQALVKTFRLKADNIVFKPIIWNYISLILLHLLSQRSENIRSVLKEEESYEYIERTLNTLPNKTNFIDDIMTNFQNIDLFIENYITS